MLLRLGDMIYNLCTQLGWQQLHTQARSCRLTSLRQLDFTSNAREQGAVPVPFAPPQLAQLAVRQPSLAMVPPQISRLSR